MWGLNDALTHSIAYGMGEEEERAKAEREKKASNPLTDERGWTVGTPTEDGDYIVCMSDSISTPMHVPCTVRDGKPFISMVYDTKQRTIRAYMPFKPYMR